MKSPLTTGAPREQAYWLESTMAALGQRNSKYRIDARGIVAFGRVTAKFNRDPSNDVFFAKLLDTLPGSGCIGGDVIPSIDPRIESVNAAAARIHGRIVTLLRALAAGKTA